MNGADFLNGISVATFAASGVFFLKFWKASRDRFYLLFTAACWLLSFERVVLFFVHDAAASIRSALTEASSWVYLFRLAAFAAILMAVVGRNKSKIYRRGSERRQS